jgi:hypothetical protein
MAEGVRRSNLARRIERRRARPDPVIDRSGNFNPDGTPKRPIDDLLIANHMLKAGFTKEDVLHVIGYMPDIETGLAGIQESGGP